MKITSIVGAVLLVTSGGMAQQPARPAITGIAFMRVYTTDAAAAQRFYGQTLGFEQHVMDGLWVYPVNKLQWLEVVPHAGPKTNDMMAAIAFTTRDAAGLERYLAAHGVTAEQPLKDGEFGVRDPEGNLVIFVQSEAVQSAVVRAADKEDRLGTIARMVADAPASPHATSHRIIHVGFIVDDPEKENTFWRELLGFRPYWHGTMHPGRTDWMSMQVPDGSDWIEYMLHATEPPSLHDSGMMDHFSLGTARMDDVLAQLQKNDCQGDHCESIQVGKDGKIQLNLFDPDLTRVEYMEFTPAIKPCCSDFTAAHPTATEAR
ncbi:MAG TPA: VOC family protein [Acidobacteriaceae bacterium]|jgi:catechol 2,3-dioxygenase-like lactoylglutathione lyase family enzyme|nr:VOC family protein [Acidobacteriaceae bacterium]